MAIDAATFDHLANPMLASLLTTLAPFAKVVATERAVAARATFRDLPLTGFAGASSADGVAALRELLRAGGPAALLCYDGDEVAALERDLGGRAFPGDVVQMVFVRRSEPWPAERSDVVDLGHGDYPAMRALVDATEPGPLSVDSPSFGRFIGIRDGDALVAMGGLRCQSDQIAELTLICTSPDHQRRGLASRIVTALVDRTLAEGRRPFLHAYAENHPAIAAYEKLGFEHTRRGRLVILGQR
jgi:ribosomal protein S18 acetylase RimI-like enzyme